MKQFKKVSSIIETSMGKFLLRESRPAVQLRTSPRKKKIKLKKDPKRLEEKSLRNLSKKQRSKKLRKEMSQIKKQLKFLDTDSEDSSSILLFISTEQTPDEDFQSFATDDELNNWKCK